jgi:two-component system response regulator MprA
MRVLVVDDDRALRDALRRALTLGGYDVVAADGGREGLERVRSSRPDVVVLDLLMPDVDGIEVCHRLRAEGDRTPILMLTARDAVDDRIAGLDAGADDYLVKPFDVEELKARVRALIRRSSPERTEYQLLELLMLNPKRVLPHSLIYERVWGYDFGPSSNALRVYIGYLRRKLADIGAPDVIHTIRGVGYSLRDAGT